MKKKTSTKTKTKNKDDYAELRAKRDNCKTCYGYGLWAVGEACPMGPLDYSDGCPTSKCPECGAGVRKNTWRTTSGLVVPIRKLSENHLKNIMLHLDERKEGDTPVRKMMEKEVKRREKTVKNTSV